MSQERKEINTRVPGQSPIDLESLGVKPEEIHSFCAEAERWLGLKINPSNVSQSTLAGEKDSSFAVEQKGAGWQKRYELMLRLYLATGFGEIIASRILDDQSFINNVNKSIRGEKSTEFAKLFTDFASRFSSLTEEKIGLPKPVLPTSTIPDHLKRYKDVAYAASLNESDPSAFYLRMMSNFYHDLPHVFNIWVLNIDAEMLARQNFFEKKKEFETIRRLWIDGKNMLQLKYLIEGYQEEMVPGWGTRESNISEILESIIDINARRFNLMARINGENYFSSQNARGTLDLQIDPSIPAVLPVSRGSLVRIVYNLIKNTAKAKEQSDEGKSDTPKLLMELNARVQSGHLLISLRDNGPGFDLNVPLPALGKLLRNDPQLYDEISREISAETAELILSYHEGQHPFAIYPLTLKQMFQMFLLRKLSGSIVREINPAEQTSGIGLASAKAIVASSYGGEIWATNHPQGGAYVLINFPLEDGAKKIESVLSEI